MRAACLCRASCPRLKVSSRPQATILQSLVIPQRHLPASCSHRSFSDVSASAVASRPSDEHIKPVNLPGRPGKHFSHPSDLRADFKSNGSARTTAEGSPIPPRQLQSPNKRLNNAVTHHGRCRKGQHPSRFGNDQAQPCSRPQRRHTRRTSLRPKSRNIVARLEIDQDTYVQWGYLRHQHTGEELRAARNAFNSWKLRFQRMRRGRDPHWPWIGKCKWLLEHDNVVSMRSAWQALDEATRVREWPLVMLSTMHTCPQKAGMVLDATLRPWPPGYAIHDVLLFITRHLDLGKAKGVRERTLQGEGLLDLVSKIIMDSPKGHISLRQRLFGLLAKKLDSAQAHELFTLLRRVGFQLHANTLIQFASKLSGSVAHKQAAFEILQALADKGADLSEARPSSVITSLLHCKTTEDGSSLQSHGFSPKDALQYFVEKGFRLNVVSSTAYLDTLCQHGEVEEAIRLALLFAESGVQLDAKAWTTLFRGAKNSLKLSNVVKALDVAKVAEVPLSDVLSNALHAVFCFAEMEVREKKHKNSPRPPLFSILIRIYAKQFDLEPLQWWVPDSLPLFLAQGTEPHGVQSDSTQSAIKLPWDFESSIVPFVDGLFSSGGDEKLQPSLTTVAIMLRAYIRSLGQPYDLMAYYRFFRSRLEEQSKDTTLPSASQLVKNQGSLIHDTLILAMTEHQGLSRPALQIFGDMLKDQVQGDLSSSETPHAKSNGLVSKDLIHPPPTVLTYTILLRGLMNQRDRVLAEQVVQVMHEHGITPNLVTWNTLTRGYARMQDIAKTVSTLQDMESAGLKPDMYTFKAFGKLKQQDRALKIMEGLIDANRQKMAQEDLYE